MYYYYDIMIYVCTHYGLVTYPDYGHYESRLFTRNDVLSIGLDWTGLGWTRELGIELIYVRWLMLYPTLGAIFIRNPYTRPLPKSVARRSVKTTRPPCCCRCPARYFEDGEIIRLPVGGSLYKANDPPVDLDNRRVGLENGWRMMRIWYTMTFPSRCDADDRGLLLGSSKSIMLAIHIPEIILNAIVRIFRSFRTADRFLISKIQYNFRQYNYYL